MKIIKCDDCKKEIEDLNIELDCLNLRYNFGYGTKHDGKKLDIDLCPDCLFNNLKKFIQ